MADPISSLDLSFFKWSSAGDYVSCGCVEANKSEAVLGGRPVGAIGRSASANDALYELLRPAVGSAVHSPDRERAPGIWVGPGLVLHATCGAIRSRKLGLI